MESKNIILQGTTNKQLIDDFKIAIKEVLCNLKIEKETTDQIMTRDEVCELLNITKSTLWKRTKSGKLKSYGQGRRVYYKRSEVIESLTPLKK